MSFFSIFTPGSLLIWLPGLLYLGAMIYSLMRLNNGLSPKPGLLAGLALFLLSLVMAIMVPANDIGRAVAFANAYDLPDTEYSSYSDLPFSVKEAWKMTALPPEERPQAPQSVSTDIFSFGGGDDEAVADTSPKPETAPDGSVYNPLVNISWLLLVLFTIFGSLIFLQSPKRFLS